jgi:6-phosphogluconolactonase
MAPPLAPELIVSDGFAAAAAERIAALRLRTVALAGGATPRPVYERLANAALPWPAMDVFFGDERCVPPADPASNYRMASEALLAGVPARVHRSRGSIWSCSAWARTGTRRRSSRATARSR